MPYADAMTDDAGRINSSGIIVVCVLMPVLGDFFRTKRPALAPMYTWLCRSSVYVSSVLCNGLTRDFDENNNNNKIYFITPNLLRMYN